jgi:hypothetical protein
MGEEKMRNVVGVGVLSSLFSLSFFRFLDDRLLIFSLFIFFLLWEFEMRHLAVSNFLTMTDSAAGRRDQCADDDEPARCISVVVGMIRVRGSTAVRLRTGHEFKGPIIF